MTALRPVPIWDLPTRMFHWSLALLIALLWLSGAHSAWLNAGLAAMGLPETDAMRWHGRCGYGVLGLVLFRLLWGFFGSDTARFVRFLRGPKAVLGYLRQLPRRDGPRHAGHNPAGGWMVAGMLGALAAQAALGLASSDGVGFEGPLASWAGEDWSERLAGWHEVLFDGLTALIGLHVAAVLFYWLYKRDNLVRPMLTGHRWLPEGTAAPRLAGLGRALGCALVAAGLVWRLVG